MSHSIQQANGNVFALFEAATAAHSERPFLLVAGNPLLTYSEMLRETARATAWLEQSGTKRGERALVQVHKSPAAVIRDLPSASVFIGTPTFYTRLLAEEIP